MCKSFGLPDPRFLVAWALFAISFFLPAYDFFRGWQCAGVCASMIGGVFDTRLAVGDLLGMICYFFFTVPNLVMLLSPFMLLRRKPLRVWTVLLAGFCFLHVLSWGIFCRIMTWGHSDPGSELRIGYYLWSASFLIFFIGVIHTRKKQKAVAVSLHSAVIGLAMCALLSGCSALPHQPKRTEPHGLLELHRIRDPDLSRQVTSIDNIAVGWGLRKHVTVRLKPGRHELSILETRVDYIELPDTVLADLLVGAVGAIPGVHAGGNNSPSHDRKVSRTQSKEFLEVEKDGRYLFDGTTITSAAASSTEF
jgi:hypothetical protein